MSFTFLRQCHHHSREDKMTSRSSLHLGLDDLQRCIPVSHSVTAGYGSEAFSLTWDPAAGWKPLWLKAFALLMPHPWPKPPTLRHAKHWLSYTRHPWEKKNQLWWAKVETFSSKAKFLSFQNWEVLQKWKTKMELRKKIHEDLLWQVCHKNIRHLPSGCNYASVRFAGMVKKGMGKNSLSIFL